MKQGFKIYTLRSALIQEIFDFVHVWASQYKIVAKNNLKLVTKSLFMLALS